MDLLRAEIAKKRKQLEKSSLIDEDKKFFKREELNKKIDEEYWQKQAEKLVKKRRYDEQHGINSEDSESRDSGDDLMTASGSKLSAEEIAKMKLKKWIKNQTGSSGEDRTNGEERILSRKEVIKRLRERDQPITLFGETEIDAFRRLRKLEIIEPESSDKGFRNDFQVCIIHLLFEFIFKI